MTEAAGIELRPADLAGTTAVRPELAEEIGLAMTGSLNLRRSVLRLLDGVCREVADWAAVALVNPRGTGLQVFGGSDLGNLLAVPRRQLAGKALERVLANGLTELLHVAIQGEDGLASLVPHPLLREEASALRPADVLGVRADRAR